MLRPRQKFTVTYKLGIPAVEAAPVTVFAHDDESEANIKFAVRDRFKSQKGFEIVKIERDPGLTFIEL